MTSQTFSDFGLSPKVLEALARKGFEEPTPIQALAIPRLLSGSVHLVARARTGTGKTAAFGLPLVERLSEPGKKPRALVLVPTRELAVQVAAEVSSLAPGPYPRVATIYGGASMGEQLRRLGRGVDLAVGTPGRVLDHVDRGTLDLSALEWLVLDEADEMLDMGFIEDIERVIDAANPERRVVMFSATMPQPIMRIARDKLGSFETVEDSTDPVKAGLTDQIWLEVRERDKLEALCRIVDAEDDFYGLVFCHTKVETDAVARALAERGYAAEALHGDVSQELREKTLARFRSRKTLILVATDVAARGIDVERLTHVVNFNLPFDPESYTHRIGRTGRAGNKGTAVTFVTPEEYRRLFALRRASGDGLRKGEVPSVGEVIEAKRARILSKAIGAASELLGVKVDADADPDMAASEPEGLGAEAGPAEPRAAGAAGSEPPRAKAFYALADELLAKLAPRDAMAAIAAAAFGQDLDPGRYGEVRDASVDSAAKARLYVGVGKADGAHAKDIAEIVKRLSGLPDRLVDDIEVLERFSFASVPFEAAERAISEARRRRGGPPVRMAEPKTGPGGRPGARGPGRGPGAGKPYGRGRPDSAYGPSGAGAKGKAYGPAPKGGPRPKRKPAGGPKGDAPGGLG